MRNARAVISRRAVRAITLVELVIAMTISTLLLGASIGGLVGVRTWQASSAVRRVHADIRQARNAAALSGRRAVCIFDTAAQSYQLKQESTPGSGAISASAMTHPLTGQAWTFAMSTLAPGLSISAVKNATKETFAFGRDGVSVNTAGDALTKDVEISFSNKAKIIIYAGSGLSEVQW